MANVSRLQRIIHLFKQRERVLAIRLARVQSELIEQTRLLENLEQYQLEYKNRMLANGQAGIEGAKLSDFDGFINQISQSIKSHDHNFAELVSQYEQAKLLWEELYKRTKVLSQLKDKMTQEESSQKEKQLLLEMEDWLAHVH